MHVFIVKHFWNVNHIYRKRTSLNFKWPLYASSFLQLKRFPGTLDNNMSNPERNLYPLHSETAYLSKPGIFHISMTIDMKYNVRVFLQC